MIKEAEKYLSVDFVKERLDYDEYTGNFIWKVAKGGKRVGDVAGSINDQGYCLIRLNKVIYRAHRLAWLVMTGCLPKGEIDHIDGDRSNNSWSNLRDVSRIENKRNQGRSTTNSSGHSGVMWYKASEKWHSQITVEGRSIHLGYYDDVNDAIKARKDAEKYYGFHSTHGQKDSWNRKMTKIILDTRSPTP